jgi:hypothetical protein
LPLSILQKHYGSVVMVLDGAAGGFATGCWPVIARGKSAGGEAQIMTCE